MRKIIYVLICICFCAFAKAQSKDVKIVNDFIEKVNQKLSTIKAAEYSMIHKVSNSESEVFTSSGYFEKLPSDKLVGCRFLIKTELGYSILYDGVNRYNMDVDTLRIVSQNEFSKVPANREEPQSPMVFNDLLNQFMLDFGSTSEMTNDYIKNYSIKVNIVKEEINNVSYYAISCKSIWRKNPSSKMYSTLYTTEDYLPLKLIIIDQNDKSISKQEYFVENYKILPSMPEGSFLPEALGDPVKTQVVTDFDEYHYFKGVERFSLERY